ncbi:MAG: ribonuclease H-like domain-containing protein [Candidatus Thermoplasmatota archaeon]|nr:ribonuclease H-like domain-containing protein [Candidatus Thermoplasmatota archaeon]
MNPFNMKKTEMQIYLTGSCKHRMPYIQHPKCYEKEIGDNPKIGILDIETTWGFNADYGFMLCYVLKEYRKKQIYSNLINKKDIASFKYDERIIKSLVDDLKNFDVVVTYNGSRFDLPYSRTRALKYKYDFPKYGFIKHIDLFYIVKYKFKFRPNSLENVCEFFGIKGKNHVHREIWLKASQGDKKSLNYVYEHCIKDVSDCTEKLYTKIIDYARKSNRSI